jgi:hypothetical protein
MIELTESTSNANLYHKDDDPEVVNRRDTIMVRLLHACARSLSDRGMVGIYADGLKPNDHCLESLGLLLPEPFYELR